MARCEPSGTGEVVPGSWAFGEQDISLMLPARVFDVRIVEPVGRREGHIFKVSCILDLCKGQIAGFGIGTAFKGNQLSPFPPHPIPEAIPGKITHKGIRGYFCKAPKSRLNRL